MRNRPDEKIVEMEGRSVLSFLFIYISAKHFYIILLRINYTAILRYHYSIVQKTDSKGASSTSFLYLFCRMILYTRFGYHGPQIKFCGWAYEMNFCVWNFMPISKIAKKEVLNRSSNY